MPEPLPYYEYQPRAAPAWQLGPWAKRWHEALGVLKQDMIMMARRAVRARYIGTCPDDALALIGDSLGWPQAPGEYANEYRERLKLSWHLAEWAGTEKGIVDAFAGLGMTNVEVRESFTPGWGRYSATPARARWINVILRHPHPFGTDFASRYGDGSIYGGGQLYGVNGDPRLLALLQQLVRKQKPAHAYCEWIAIVLAGDVIEANGATDGDPDGGLARVAYIPVPAL